jgi:hypothetical protein
VPTSDMTLLTKGFGGGERDLDGAVTDIRGNELESRSPGCGSSGARPSTASQNLPERPLITAGGGFGCGSPQPPCSTSS